MILAAKGLSSDDGVVLHSTVMHLSLDVSELSIAEQGNCALYTFVSR